MKGNDIAKLAGVSQSTVSRVINNYPNVPEETRRMVMEIIERYDYAPNTSARALAGKPHNTVGLFIISTSEKNVLHHVYQNSYFAPYLEIIVDALNSIGYYVLVNVIYNSEDYSRIKNAFLQKRVDCGIIVGTETAAADTFGDILKKGYPLAIIDIDPDEMKRFSTGQENLTIIDSMNYEGACEAVEYLIGIGHTDIGLIAGRMTTCSGRERNKAFMDVMAKNGLPIRDEFIMKGEFLKNVAVQEVTNMLDRGVLPTAIFSTSDEMALSAIDVFKARGIKVPEEISLIGFDDIALTSQITPALTTVNVPFYEMAKIAVETVINALERGHRSQNIVRLPVKLVIRDSCAHRPQKASAR